MRNEGCDTLFGLLRLVGIKWGGDENGSWSSLHDLQVGGGSHHG
jgi:hypothetical protein